MSSLQIDETALTDPLLDPDTYAGDPFPLYARLRAEAPVARNDTLGLWMVSRHDDVVAVSRDPESFCSSKGIMTFEIGAEYATPPTMMHTDPPDHTRYRTLVQPGFRPSYMRALEPGIRARARALVDTIEAGVHGDNLVSQWFEIFDQQPAELFIIIHHQHATRAGTLICV